MRLTFVALGVIALGACRKPARPIAAPAPARPAPVASAPRADTRLPCGLDTPVLTGDRAGALRLGMSAAAAKRACPIVRDTMEDAEGEKVRRLIFAAAGDTLRAMVVDDTVQNILVEGARFMTTDSVRVGMPLARLLGYAGVTGAYGEGDFYVMSDASPVCGLSFLIDFGRRDAPFIRRPNRESLEAYGETAKIEAVLVRRCVR